jgi:predicted ATPase/DNA-binding CsgD family transcriptional regulator
VVDPDQERRRIFHALAQVLLLLAAKQPLLVILEDLHWSDETTLQFLTYFCRQLSSIHDRALLLLMTYRSEEVSTVLEHSLTELERQRLTKEIGLNPLTMAEVDVMVRAILGLSRGLRRDYLETLHQRAEGNPLFIEELLKSSVSAATELGDGNEPDQRPWQATTIPRTISEAVSHRTIHLSKGARRLLEFAAVAGQRFDLALLQQLTNETLSALLDQMRELLSAHLVIEESADHFRFRHALTREAVYLNLLGMERRELHRRIANAMEQAAGDAVPDASVADLAFHFYNAQSWEKALLYCQRAGERALSLFTPSAAVRHLTQAIEASRQLGGAASAKLFRLRAAAYEVLGEFETALADHEGALAIARRNGEQLEEWEILLGLGMLWSARDYEVTRQHYGAALDLARALGDQRLIARSLNRVGNYHVNIEEPVEAISRHEEALQIFEALNDTEGIGETVDLLGMTWLLGGDLGKSRAYYQKAARIFEERGNRQGYISAKATMSILSGAYHTETLPPAATFEEAMAWLDTTQRMAAQMSWRAAECYALWNRGVCLGPKGEYEEALRYTREAIVLAEETEHRAWLSAALFVQGATQYDLLDFPQSRASLEQALEIARELGSMLWTRTAAGFLARCYVQQGDFELASKLIDGVLAADAPARTIGERGVQVARAQLQIAQGKPVEALAVLDRLHAAIEPAEFKDVPVLARLRAEALMKTGDYAASEHLYLEAAARAREQRAFSQLWLMYSGLSALYDRMREYGKSRQAQEEFLRVIDYLTARITDPAAREGFRLAALARLPSPRSRSPRQAAKDAFDGLTEREREIASLVADGKSNAIIGQSLVISERTVETHVANILAKLGFTSRSQIAAWAAERGLR